MTNANDQHMEEQRRADRIIALIRQRIDALSGGTGEIKNEIVDIRRNFWDDVTINFEDAVETAETYASMKQQAELLSERERSHRHAVQQLKTLNKLEQSPYFGRVDLLEDGQPEADIEQIYLGVGSLLDDDGETYLIYDWRTPVSSLYYDFGPGPVRYETPAGRVEGEMKLKRQYIIRQGRIRAMFDAGITIGDELLQEVLGKQSDAQMKSIVATIQQEQNQIIRNEKARLLIVQGAAGSGKTSAALQRAAYLLYRYRGTLASDQIVLFSPNPMFNSYVSTVLPELGEQNMQQTTYQQYLEHRLGASFTLEDPFAQMEYILTGIHQPEYNDRISAIRLKSGTDFMNVMDDFIDSLGEANLVFDDIRFRGGKLIAKEAIEEQFYGLDRSISIANRLRMLSSLLLKELTRLGKLERDKPWVEEQIELLDQDDYASAFEELKRKNHFTEQSFNDYAEERKYLAAQIVQRKFKKLRSRVKRLAYLNVTAIYKRMFEDGWTARARVLAEEETSPERIEAIGKLTIARLNEGEMPYEDATPYLYLKERLEGFHTNTLVKHVFIDEAQDYTPFQYHYLKRIFPSSKMTVLGDSNQSIFAHAAETNGFEQLADLFAAGQTERIILQRSYRSTRQIVGFTSRMIPGGEVIIPFNRNGAEPTITKAENAEAMIDGIIGRINGLKEEGCESIAVICKTAEESARAYRLLSSDCPELRLVDKDTATFEKGIAVIPAYLAKGVEFDAVIIGNASNECYGRESERKLFYTACTRAMHELHLYYIGQLTPFIVN